MTEQQRYEVVRQEPDFELRRYPAHLVAEVEVDGSFESAGNTAFRPLVAYIRGRNQASQSLAMTAPVLQRRDAAADTPETVETMTTETSPGRYVVSFVMPEGSTRESLPDPGDARVDDPGSARGARRRGAVLRPMDVHVVRAADRPAAAGGARRRARDDRSTAFRPLRPALDAVVPTSQRSRRPRAR